MKILKMSLASGSRYSIAMCMLLACLNVARADFDKDLIVDNNVDRASHRANGDDRWARGGPLHLFPSSSEQYRDDGSSAACDAPSGGPHRHSRHGRLNVGLSKKSCDQ
jgi:hypothetical protein